MDIRAGHYPTEWKKTYYKPMSMSDFHIGRCLGVGMVGTDGATVLPAHFVNPGTAVIVDVCKKVFPVWSDWTSKWSKIAKRALAAVVHHREWIITNKLSVSTTSALFTAPGLLTSLSSQLGDINGDGLARHGVDPTDTVYLSNIPSPTSYRSFFPKL